MQTCCLSHLSPKSRSGNELCYYTTPNLGRTGRMPHAAHTFLSTIVGISDSSSSSEAECGLCCTEILGLSFPAPSTGSGNILEGPVIIPSAMHVRFFDSASVVPPIHSSHTIQWVHAAFSRHI